MPAGDRFGRRRLAARLAQLRWLWMGLTAAAVAAALVWVVFVSTWLGVQTVAISGVTTVSKAKIRAAASIDEGRPLALLDSAAVVHRLTTIPRVEAVTVTRAWPHTVRIDVRERVAIAAVTQHGHHKVMDRHGVLFKEPGTGSGKGKAVSKRLPKVSITAAGAERRDALTEAAKVIGALDPSIAKKVQKVSVASMDSIILNLHNGDRVRWGSADQSGRKAQVLKRLLELPGRTYDVTAPERPTTR